MHFITKYIHGIFNSRAFLPSTETIRETNQISSWRALFFQFVSVIINSVTNSEWVILVFYCKFEIEILFENCVFSCVDKLMEMCCCWLNGSAVFGHLWKSAKPSIATNVLEKKSLLMIEGLWSF